MSLYNSVTTGTMRALSFLASNSPIDVAHRLYHDTTRTFTQLESTLGSLTDILARPYTPAPVINNPHSAFTAPYATPEPWGLVYFNRKSRKKTQETTQVSTKSQPKTARSTKRSRARLISEKKQAQRKETRVGNDHVETRVGKSKTKGKYVPPPETTVRYGRVYY